MFQPEAPAGRLHLLEAGGDSQLRTEGTRAPWGTSRLLPACRCRPRADAPACRCRPRADDAFVPLPPARRCRPRADARPRWLSGPTMPCSLPGARDSCQGTGQRLSAPAIVPCAVARRRYCSRGEVPGSVVGIADGPEPNHFATEPGR